MIQIKKYSKELRQQWDEFIDISKNGTFMLKRSYMDYHSYRFTDCSLMFYEENKLLAVMPASIHDNELRSHGGLTYGGLIYDSHMTVELALNIFENLKDFLLDHEIRKLIYKKVPAIYNRYPADEDLYALFIEGAELFRRDISTTIFLENRINFSELRKRNIKKAVKNNIVVQKSNDFQVYIEMLTTVLKEYHAASPVHSALELETLHSSFPDNIKLFAAFKEETMLAGVVTFETDEVAHAQYICNSNEGRKVGALDIIFDYLINKEYISKKYFDFGISTEDNGRYLNKGLIAQKEGFGGRAVVYDFYEWRL